MNVYRYHMASASLKLLLLVSVSLLLGVTSAQELYEDEPNLEQYSPFLGENFIDYPILEEYGVPTVEEFPDEGPEEDDGDDDENEENDSTETEQKDKKEEIKHKDNEHAQKASSALNTKSDAREKRQLPLQDPVEIAREKLQRAIKAAQALNGIEKELGLNPSIIENKTTKLESELKNEEKNFKKLADDAQDKPKKRKFVKLEKEADDDVHTAENILKLIVKLEAAKYLAKERAQEDLDKAQKRKLASMPPVMVGQPLLFPPQDNGYFGGVQQPAYQPMIPPYTASYQPQMFQGMSPPSTVLSPASLAAPTNAAPQFQTAYKENMEIQRINAIKAAQASASVLPSQSNAQQTVELVAPESTKVASFSSEGGNTAINTDDIQFNDAPNPSAPKKPAVVQPPNTAQKTQPNAHAPASNDLKAPQVHAKPQETNKDLPVSAISTPPASQPAQPFTPAQPVVPAHPVAPSQPISPPAQTVESAIGQSNALMSQAAPLTASFNPSSAAQNLSPMSRYFDSSSNPPSMFAPQSFYQPMPNPQTSPHAVAPPTQPKKPSLKGPEPANPAVAAFTSAFNDHPQSSPPPSPENVQPSSPAAYSGEQALSGAYPSNSFYSWNTQSLPSSSPQYAWNSPMYYPAPAQYQAPVNPLLAEAYRKLHDSKRASLAMSKIEEAIGLSPSSVKHIIDDIEKQARQEENRYEDEMSKEKAGINKEKQLLQNDEVPDGEDAKKKIKEEEAKLRDDIKKENVAKQEVDKVKKIEKILTIIEAAKYSAMQRAKKRINKLKGADEGLDGDDIRKRDLEDLERDIKRRRRNEINIWLKGSRNRIDTSHFLRNHLGRLETHREESSRWESEDKKLFDHSENEKLSKSVLDEVPKERKLHKLKFFKTLVSNKELDSGKQFSVEKRTEVPEKPEKPANAIVMAKMLEKMDRMFKIQGDILKYLKTEHEIHRLQKKPSHGRLRRSLHHSKHHKKSQKVVEGNKRKPH